METKSIYLTLRIDYSVNECSDGDYNDAIDLVIKPNYNTMQNGVIVEEIYYTINEED
jgi:hypothetical protein